MSTSPSSSPTVLHTGLVDGELSVIKSRGSAPALTILSSRVPLIVVPLRMKCARRTDCKSLAGVFALKVLCVGIVKDKECRC